MFDNNIILRAKSPNNCIYCMASSTGILENVLILATHRFSETQNA